MQEALERVVAARVQLQGECDESAGRLAVMTSRWEEARARADACERQREEDQAAQAAAAGLCL